MPVPRARRACECRYPLSFQAQKIKSAFFPYGNESGVIKHGAPWVGNHSMMGTLHGAAKGTTALSSRHRAFVTVNTSTASTADASAVGGERRPTALPNLAFCLARSLTRCPRRLLTSSCSGAACPMDCVTWLRAGRNVHSVISSALRLST